MAAAKPIKLNPLKPNYRAALAFAHDVLASAACWVLAFWLRLNLEIPEVFLPALAMHRASRAGRRSPPW